MSELRRFFEGAKKEFGMDRNHEDFEEITSIPVEFHNSCWHNNTSPSVSTKERSLEDDIMEVTVWIDPKDPEKREINSGKQFILVVSCVNCQYVFMSDSWQEIISMAPKALLLMEDIDKYAKVYGHSEYDKAFEVCKEEALRLGFIET